MNSNPVSNPLQKYSDDRKTCDDEDELDYANESWLLNLNQDHQNFMKSQEKPDYRDLFLNTTEIFFEL